MLDLKTPDLSALSAPVAPPQLSPREEAESLLRTLAERGYQVNRELLDLQAKLDALVGFFIERTYIEDPNDFNGRVLAAALQRLRVGVATLKPIQPTKKVTAFPKPKRRFR